MPTRRFIVHGRVQGVGFRAFTEGLARQMELTGEVWNRRDGGVEVLASHEDAEQLDEFCLRLENGPGRVDRVSSEPAPEGRYVDFEVGLTR